MYDACERGDAAPLGAVVDVVSGADAEELACVVGAGEADVDEDELPIDDEADAEGELPVDAAEERAETLPAEWGVESLQAVRENRPRAAIPSTRFIGRSCHMDELDVGR